MSHPCACGPAKFLLPVFILFPFLGPNFILSLQTFNESNGSFSDHLRKLQQLFCNGSFSMTLFLTLYKALCTTQITTQKKSNPLFVSSAHRSHPTTSIASSSFCDKISATQRNKSIMWTSSCGGPRLILEGYSSTSFH